MATDGPTPPPCDPDILTNGKAICVVDGRSNAIENWVRSVATIAKAKVDWSYYGGRGVVLHLGDDKSRQRVLNAINEIESELNGRILSIINDASHSAGVEVSEAPTTVVREIKGQLVIDDPVAVAMIHAVAKHNCKNTLELNTDRVKHFKNRLAERGMTADQAVIVLLNVDDVHGGPLADALMPVHNWQEFRDNGEIPFARGLAMRNFIQEALETFDKEAATKLRSMSDVAVVVVDHGVAEVFTA